MVGIVSYGIYLPEDIITSEEASKIFGIPKDVIEEKQGWKMKRVSKPFEMPSEMITMAAKRAFALSEKYGIKSSDIDAILYVGSDFKDYGVWMMATKIQDAFEIKEAFAFDIAAMCVGYPVGLAIAKRISDLAENILLVAASKESYLVNPRNHKLSWLFDFADGASAVVISRNFSRNKILESSFISDGSFWGAVVVKSLGASVFMNYDSNFEEPRYIERPYFDSLLDKNRLKEDLSKISKKNFVRVIEEAVERSGYSIKDIDLLVINHMKKSFHIEIVKELGIEEQKAPYLEDYGHTQSSDMIIGLDIGIKRGLVRDGSLVVLASGGTGFLWGATVLRWG